MRSSSRNLHLAVVILSFADLCLSQNITFSTLRWRQESVIPARVRIQLFTGWVWQSFSSPDLGCEGSCKVVSNVLQCKQCSGMYNSKMVPSIGDVVSFYDPQGFLSGTVQLDLGQSRILTGDRSLCRSITSSRFGQCIEGVVQDVNVLDNTMVVLSEYIQEYSSIGNYSVQFKGCCRLTSLVNNAGSYWQDKVMIQLATRLPNESPILARAMLVEAYAGQTMSFKIQSFQPEGKKLSWRIGTLQEFDPLGTSKLPGPPASLSLDATTGEVQWYSTTTVGLFVVYVVVEAKIDTYSAGSTFISFIIRSNSASSATRPAVSIWGGATQSFVCGRSNQMQIYASSSSTSAENLRVQQLLAGISLYNESLWTADLRPRFVSSSGSANLTWSPPCELLASNVRYLYSGPSMLDVYQTCFTARDEIKLVVSPPSCSFIRVLRCTQPVLTLLGAPGNFHEVTVRVGRMQQFAFNGSDDSQTLSISMVPSLSTSLVFGFDWNPYVCSQTPATSAWNFSSGQSLTTCNPVMSMLNFSANFSHAGLDQVFCFQSRNDQQLCSEEDRRSTPICIRLIVPAPSLSWTSLTPSEGTEIFTYLGCQLDVPLAAVDLTDYFDIFIQPDSLQYSLPAGASLSYPACQPSSSSSPDLQVPGIFLCTRVERRILWTPSNDQQGLSQRVCFQAGSLASNRLSRCLILTVSKCRYCARKGESLLQISQEFATDWLQIFAANPQLLNPDKVGEAELINLGPLYPARRYDTLTSIADRFQSNILSLVRSNPDITDINAELPQGMLVCVLPGTCPVVQ